MSRFIIIRDTLNNLNEAIDVLKTLVGHNINIIEKDNCCIIKYNYDNQRDIYDLLISFSNENIVNMTCYISSLQESNNENEIVIGMKLLEKLPAGIYNLKEGLLNAKNVDNPKFILDTILFSTGIDEDFIKQFVFNDLNISKASKSMYIHRNTLNYKLDKLLELSTFDLRCFLDSYILFNLMQRK